jgi:hypothetical protein
MQIQHFLFRCRHRRRLGRPTAVSMAAGGAAVFVFQRANLNQVIV